MDAAAKKSKKLVKIIRWLIVAGVLLLVGMGVTRAVLWEMRPRALVSLGTMTFRADVAETERARAKGLSGRTALGRDEAMLFQFERDDQWVMVMRDMNFPIDMIWLDSERQVVHIEHGVQPDTEPYMRYTSPAPARYVLEVASGQAHRGGVRIGSTMEIEPMQGGR